MAEHPYKDLVHNRAKGSPSALTAWDSIVQRLDSANVGERAIKILVTSSGTIGELAVLCDYLTPGHLGTFTDAQEAVDRMFQMADGSAVEIGQWVKALPVFHRWITANGRRTTLSASLGYLECTASILGRQTETNTLGDAVAYMLETYGFEGSEL